MSALRRVRAVAHSAALTGALVLGVTGTAPAAEDMDCSAIPYQDRAPACGPMPSRDPGGPATTPPAAPLDDEDGGPACSGFATHAEAQAALARGTADPSRLDPDDDGIACEQHFGTEGQQVAVHPEGGVAAGGALRR